MAATIGGIKETTIIPNPINDMLFLKKGTLPNAYPAYKNNTIQTTAPIIL